MAHAINFSVDPKLLDAFNASESLNRALTVQIADEAFVLRKELPTMQGADEQTEFGRMKGDFIVAAEACFVFYRDASQTWNMFSFVPDDAPVRDKMLYSSSRAVLLKALGGTERIPKSQQWTELDEVKMAVSQSELERQAEERSVMTEVEKMKLDADRVAAEEAAGSKQTSVAGLTFPMAPEAQASIAVFKAGSLCAVVLAIEGETVVQLASAATATLEELRKLLPTASPSYVLYRWSHVKANEAASEPLFIYMCPEESPVRSKMLHASTNGPMLTSFTSDGLEITTSIEGLEASELVDKELHEQVYAAAAGGGGGAAPQGGLAAMIKAAPPGGRGGRKLVSRNRGGAAAAPAEIS